MALDGKTLRGSRNGDAAGVPLLSALLQREGVVLGQMRVGDRTNEIPYAPQLLEPLPLEGAVVTADALHAQKETARFLVDEKKADYLFVAEDNQPSPRSDIELPNLGFYSPLRLRRPTTHRAHRGVGGADTPNAHGRLEVRSIGTSTDLDDYLPFPHCGQVFQIGRRREALSTGKVHHGIVRGRTRLSPDRASPARLLGLARGPWSIEDRLHRVRDVTCDEDRRQARTGHGPQMLPCLRNLAIRPMRLAGATNIRAALRDMGARPCIGLRLLGL